MEHPFGRYLPVLAHTKTSLHSALEKESLHSPRMWYLTPICRGSPVTLHKHKKTCEKWDTDLNCASNRQIFSWAHAIRGLWKSVPLAGSSCFGCVHIQNVAACVYKMWLPECCVSTQNRTNPWHGQFIAEVFFFPKAIDFCDCGNSFNFERAFFNILASLLADVCDSEDRLECARDIWGYSSLICIY